MVLTVLGGTWWFFVVLVGSRLYLEVLGGTWSFFVFLGDSW